MKRSLWIKAFVFGLLIFPLAVSGCGKKGPPRPPKVDEITAPARLTYEIKGDMVHLRWKIADGSNAERFEVYRAEQSVADCKGCPVKFEMIEKLPSDQTSVDYPVETGTRYYFRVRSTGTGDRKSDYSNTVRFER